MYERQIIDELLKWKNAPVRKPLVLRGARQTGKTTVVDLFSREFEQYISMNLERPRDAENFANNHSAEDILQSVFLQYHKDFGKRSATLLFIDEIQQSAAAVAMLRYFYEEYPELHVIAAGSSLESIFDKGVNFPVGRVEYRILHPFSFAEFLAAVGENQALELYNTIPLPAFAHTKLLSLFHLYTLIGGMPEVVKTYVEHRDLTALQPVYESLLATYFDDAEKYASNQSQIQLMRHAVKSVFYEAGTRISYAGFGASAYNSKEMGETLRTLEKMFLINLVFPTTQTQPPYKPDIKKSPRLHVVDTGMLNFFSGLQTELIGTKDLNALYKGKISEHIVGQEFLAAKYNVFNELHFWVRDKKQSVAETDFLFQHDGRMFPVEVKSGTSGKLRSLHQYLDTSETDFAVRLYAGNIALEEHQTIGGKNFKLLNLPYFLSGKLDDYLTYYLSLL
jgi:predicted AAA+ superfamily ATPase